MLDFFKKCIQVKTENNVELSKNDKAHKIKVAVSALLLEVAHCDDEFSDQEKDQITEIIKNKFELTKSEADELLKTAEEERERSVDLWHFTNLINENYSLEDKIRLIEMLWAVIYVDKVLDKHEDYLIHKLSNLLNLDHQHFINAKLKVKSG